jgi:hypothetical protein
MVYFSNLSLRCANYFITAAGDCHLANGTIYFPSETEDDCLKNYTYCWTPDSIVTGLMVPLNQTVNCSDSDRRNLFEWLEPKWIGGTFAFTNWTQRKSIAANVVSPTLDYTRIQEVVSYPSSLSVKASLQNEVLAYFFYCDI